MALRRGRGGCSRRAHRLLSAYTTVRPARRPNGVGGLVNEARGTRKVSDGGATGAGWGVAPPPPACASAVNGGGGGAAPGGPMGQRTAPGGAGRDQPLPSSHGPPWAWGGLEQAPVVWSSGAASRTADAAHVPSVGRGSPLPTAVRLGCCHGAGGGADHRGGGTQSGASPRRARWQAPRTDRPTAPRVRRVHRRRRPRMARGGAPRDTAAVAPHR